MTTKSRAGTGEVLPVLFRKWKPRPEHGESGGDVDALFPTEPGDTQGKFVACFSMREGNVTADLRGVIDASVPATPSEYASIKRALEKMGYKLKVYERTPPGAYQKLMAKVRAFQAGRTGGGGAVAGAHGRAAEDAARRVAEEEIAEMAESLRKRRYADPRESAERLHAEGMGPFELEGRIKQSSPENERARRFPSLSYNFTFIRHLG